MVPRRVVILMSNYDATAVFKDPVIPMRWSVHEILRWAASRAIVTLFTLTRAAVFCAQQSVHTLAQSRQENLAIIQSSSGAGIIRSRQATAAMDRFAWCNKRRKVTPVHVSPWEWSKR